MNKQDLIKQAMSELGKRSAKKNKRDYSAMGKKGAAKRWKKKIQIIDTWEEQEDGTFVSKDKVDPTATKVSIVVDSKELAKVTPKKKLIWINSNTGS